MRPRRPRGARLATVTWGFTPPASRTSCSSRRSSALSWTVDSSTRLKVRPALRRCLGIILAHRVCPEAPPPGPPPRYHPRSPALCRSAVSLGFSGLEEEAASARRQGRCWRRSSLSGPPPFPLFLTPPFSCTLSPTAAMNSSARVHPASHPGHGRDLPSQVGDGQDRRVRHLGPAAARDRQQRDWRPHPLPHPRACLSGAYFSTRPRPSPTIRVPHCIIEH